MLEILQSIESIAIIIGVIIGIPSAVLTVIAYRWENERRQDERLHQKTDRLFKLRERLWELMSTKVGESGKSLRDLLPHWEDDTECVRIPSAERIRLVGFFKEIGILVRGRAVDKVEAFYLFAYFAMRCEENKHFWDGLDKDTIFWRPFFEFVEEMRKVEKAERAKN